MEDPRLVVVHMVVEDITAVGDRMVGRRMVVRRTVVVLMELARLEEVDPMVDMVTHIVRPLVAPII